MTLLQTATPADMRRSVGPIKEADETGIRFKLDFEFKI